MNLPLITISEEALGPTRTSIVTEIERRAYAADRQRRIDELAAKCGDRRFAELFYMPAIGTPF